MLETVMENLSPLILGYAPLWCVLLAFVSAVLPWVNAEVLILSLPAVADSRAELVVLVLISTAGQMAGKCVIYWVARHGGVFPSAWIARWMERWRGRAVARPASSIMLVAASSLVGIPPFFAMSVVAGALKMNFGSFFVAGACGRLVRFFALAFLSGAALRLVGQ